MPPLPNAAPTIRALLAEAECMLADSPHPEKARRDAEALLLHTLHKIEPGRNRAWLIAHSDETLTAQVAEEFNKLVRRRATGEPIQYITGTTEFYRLSFLVNRNVLIPRPETELLVEKAVGLATFFRRPRILDVGTGSGAIALALANELPESKVTAVDISEGALSVARANAERLGLAKRVRFLKGDLLEPIIAEQFEMIVSNPPYVAERDRGSLPVEVREFEPAQALFAGEDGLAAYRRCIPAAYAALTAGGFVLLEIGFDQSEAIDAMLHDAGFTEVEFAADLQGILRVAIARRL